MCVCVCVCVYVCVCCVCVCVRVYYMLLMECVCSMSVSVLMKQPVLLSGKSYASSKFEGKKVFRLHNLVWHLTFILN